MQKVVFLVDMNAFFISCEMTRKPELLDKPAAVAGNPKTRSGIILAANYDARRYGVKTTMVIHQALKLCPNLILVPPDHSLYEKKSQQVMEILSRFSPVVEQNSIDEAWMDMTGTQELFGEPNDVAKKIMNTISEELGLWCSIGISENKFLAKMASEIKKPMGITEIWIKDIADKLWPLPVLSMYGVGKQTALKLSNFGIQTIGDLAKIKLAMLVKMFGKQGMELHKLANGIDESAVTPHAQGEMKSIGRSTTLPEDVTNIELLRRTFLEMCEEVGFEARRNDKKCKTIQITIKYSDFQSITRQTSVEPTYLTKDIYEKGFALMKKNWNSIKPVRLIGISISSFGHDSLSTQLSLFDECHELQVALGFINKDIKEEKLERAMDAIRCKHGTAVVSRAVQINRKIKDSNSLE